MWSPVEKTALAEAEVEYHDHTSHQVWVRFKGGTFIDRSAPFTLQHQDAFTKASVVIWTTTPWTIPQNRAVAFNPGRFPTGIYRDRFGRPRAAVQPSGRRVVLADKLAPDGVS